ncbi:MAG: pyrroline-5-carboxylate reductase [Limibacillus sp.]
MSDDLRLPGPLLLVGCGKMGGALLDGWLARNLPPSDVFIVEPFEEAREALNAKGVTAVAAAGELPGDLEPAIVMLAVKPQMMDDALPAYRRFVRPGCFFLSIAAGKTISYFEQHLGEEAAIVRSMPNTPAAVGRGITVYCPNDRTSAEQAALAGELLAAIGEVDSVEEEGLLDAVTALSGGGPAYVFLLIECMTRGGIEAGLPEALAERLARSTVAGAGELARRSEDPASTLRQNVTSPGGTTLEALKVLMAEDGMEPLFVKAIAAATKRSRELAE